jgi:hypothetical protein
MRNPELAALIGELKNTLDRVADGVAKGQLPDAEDFVTLRGSTEQVIEIASRPAMFDLAKIQPSEAVRDRNEARVSGDDEPCTVCRKPVNHATAKHVHMSERGNLYPNTIDTDTAASMPEGTMFFFPVGPECAKKIPKAYLY